MNKIYKANNVYYLKLGLLVICIGITYLLYDFIIYTFLGNIQRLWAQVIMFVLLGVFLLLALFAMYIVITSNKPVIILEKDHLRYKNRKIFFKDIKIFYPSKGGSEPFVVTHSNQQIDLELSWLRKTDRVEIESAIAREVSSLSQ
ncbi:hypothetical protein [Ascidiimonas aurantiaca]|uniref:hypothetical protein n=1 Tax=Ascidiimonas aurantiaca TaxID=1685432 RepID=UPI0030EF1610